MQWLVYIEDFNQRKIKEYNIFDHFSFLNDCKAAYKRYKDDKEKFLEEIRRSMIYYFWSKCEWEIILQSWPPRDDFHDKKIDVFDQVRLNWDRFCDYIWGNRAELAVKRKRKAKPDFSEHTGDDYPN